TIMVFLPVVFIAEEAGQLYSDIAIAISASIMVSMLVAITVIPTASARMSFKDNSEKTVHPLQKRITDRIDWILQTTPRRIGCIAITVIVSLAIVLLLTPPAEYLPEGEEPKTFASLNAPPGYNLQTMAEIGEELQ